ncbi:MAG: diaminopimelate decarboxylase [bacterium]|nr:diaminopimelate decarboxylase [bacterium]
MPKETYERPVIIKHQSGPGNKFGRSRVTRVMSHIDGFAVKDLARDFGSPLFVFSEKTIRQNYRDAFRSFNLRYPKVSFAWSYKTNYLDAVCAVFHSEGARAEVVSEYEFAMARRIGVPGNSIIFNGPYKPYHALVTAVSEGACIHIDHYDELFLLEQIAGEMNRTIDVGIRLNMDTGIYPSWDRFGFNFDNSEALDAARRMFAGGKLRINGVHTHIGTCVLEPAAFGKAVEKLVLFTRQVESELNFKIEYIDIGGGFPSCSTLHEQYAPGEESNPPIDAYAEAITSSLLAGGFSPDRLPTLVLETGRALIDDAGFCVTSVVANKRLANGSRSLVIDAGVNSLFTSFWYKHAVYPVDEKNGMFEETAIYGPLCMNIDVVRPSMRLPALDPGDLLVIGPVGAYNVSQWLQFIRMRPAVVMIGENGEVAKIRDEENIDAIKNWEHVPAWLKEKK